MLQEKLQKSFDEDGGKFAPNQVKEDFKKLSEELGNLKQTGNVFCQYLKSEKIINIDIDFLDDIVSQIRKILWKELMKDA